MKESSPFISIIIPCYNQGQYLPEALQSVVAQTYSDWECIVVNDGSSDNTETIAQQWTGKENRIKYIKKENGGLASARNSGINLARGQWILPLDADDKIGSEYLQQAVDLIHDRNDISVVYCDAEYFGGKTGKWKLPPYSFNYLLIRNLIFCTAFFKKEDWLSVGGYDSNMIYGYEDWEFWINLLSKSKGGVEKLDYIGFYYRQKDESMIDSMWKEKDKKKKMHVYIVEKHQDVFLTISHLLAVTEYNIDLVYGIEAQQIEYNRLRSNINRLKSNFLYRIYRFLSDRFCK